METEKNDAAIERKVAWQLCTELCTRITTQRLPLKHGDEVTALDSVVEFFRLARKTVAENPGCTRCAPLVLDSLNGIIRPFTALWHGLKESGRLSSVDERYAFRAELSRLQAGLQALALELAAIAAMPLPSLPAEGPDDDAMAGRRLDTGRNGRLGFGIRIEATSPHEATLVEMNRLEREAIDARRCSVGLPASEGSDAVGLAYSGGGLRSATFALGMTQVLAQRGLLKEVDFMSTGSGGGYLGSFISAHGIQAFDPTTEGAEPPRVRHLRNHSKYLAEGGLATWAHMAYTLLNGMVVSGVLLVVTALFIVGLAALGSLATWLWLVSIALFSCLAFGAMLLQVTRYGQEHSEKLRLWGATGLFLGVAYGLSYIVVLGGGVLVALVAPLWAAIAPTTLYCLAAVMGVLLLLAWFSDPNGGSLHAYYRDRLARTFIASQDNGTPSSSRPPLTDLNAQGRTAPYHLLNAALNVPGSVDPELRGRRSDFFVFSRFYCGSALTGWRPTSEVKVDLATAMAISGAAASPNMGTLSRPLPRFMLGLLGLRLGWWLPWPKAGASTPGRAAGLSCFLRELTGWGMDEHQPQLNLSDGGHIENLALYELLRRRCRYIIAIDGECDPLHHFGGLLTLTRMADIDLGVKILHELGDLRLNERSETRSHFIVARIVYPDTEVHGLLLYAKLSMTGNESEFLRNFRREFPDFPHQSTAQQLFTEAQFEAYRALGEHVGSELFAPSLLGDQPVRSVKEWMGRLSTRLQPNA